MFEGGGVINDKTGKVQEANNMMDLTYNAMKAPFYSKSNKQQQDTLESIQVEEFP